MLIYYRVIKKKYPHLTNNQVWAVVSLAINCKWNAVFAGIINKALLNNDVPPFEKFCYYKSKTGWKKSNNLLQSRLYEKALFMYGLTDNSFMWVNPYRSYSNEIVTVTDLEQWYKDHYKDRNK